MKKMYLYSIFLSVLISCSSQEKNINEGNERLEKLKNIEKEGIVNKLVLKYNISYNWDTLRSRSFRYTIDFKPIINSSCQLLTKIKITDIYEKDSTNYVSIKSGYFRAFYFDFPITKEQVTQLKEKECDYIMVVKINSIKKIKLSLIGEIAGDKDVSVRLKNSDDFLGVGEILEIVAVSKTDK